MEDFENNVIGCFCTLLDSLQDDDCGEIVDVSGNLYVVRLTSGQQITLSHDDVIICD
ncbi:ribonuclease P [Duncaniella muris]|uniref:ribonuclease P n=1 Tax=Duncaniella muris TaxID=2094150 RepID=UPI000E9D7190|nr:ribonuclease P [Duncaniella muris]HBN64075.1 ribonuclease P [Porphyromonadaceae bacterium]